MIYRLGAMVGQWQLGLLLAVGVALCASGCNTAADGAPPEVFEPGPFTGPPAPAVKAAGAPDCPDPFAIPSASQLPFWFGAGTAAYQIEGAVSEGGRWPSIWDTFAAEPGHIAGGETGAEADDFFHRYLQDIQLMRPLGIRHFRLSLSWPRLLPNGTGPLNQAGVDFYGRVIDALLANCIQPHLTLYHWDLPQALQDAYGGWLGAQVVEDFAAYAEAAFSLFGDRVKYWTTLNEPATFCNSGHRTGTFAPGRCSDRAKCPEGDSLRELELCAYHALLAHTAAVPAFRRLVVGGKVSMNTNLAPFYVPLTDSQNDADATERLNRWTSGQFLDPLLTGDWTPARLSALGPSVLPRFTPEQSAALRQAKPDYLALNFYNGAYGFFNSTSNSDQSTTTSAAGVPLPVADSPWLHVFPAALRAMLAWVHERYGGVPVVITENGVDMPGEDTQPLDVALCDRFRVDFYRGYLGNASLAVRQDGVPLQGYFAWSLLDNFEWADGYSKRFGIVRVDYATQQRYFKASSLWLSRLFGLSDARSAQQAVQQAQGPAGGEAASAG